MPSRGCIVPNCPSTKLVEISRHRIPWKKAEVRKQWIAQLTKAGVRPDKVTPTSRVCAVHFTDGKRLSLDDIPTLFPGTG